MTLIVSGFYMTEFILTLNKETVTFQTSIHQIPTTPPSQGVSGVPGSRQITQRENTHRGLNGSSRVPSCINEIEVGSSGVRSIVFSPSLLSFPFTTRNKFLPGVLQHILNR